MHIDLIHSPIFQDYCRVPKLSPKLIFHIAFDWIAAYNEHLLQFSWQSFLELCILFSVQWFSTFKFSWAAFCDYCPLVANLKARWSRFFNVISTIFLKWSLTQMIEFLMKFSLVVSLMDERADCVQKFHCTRRVACIL